MKPNTLLAGRRNTGIRSKPTDDAGQTFECKWTLDGRGTTKCNQRFSSFEVLLSHAAEHAARDPKGLSCRWARCVNQKGIVYPSTDAIQKHIKTHISAQLDEDVEEKNSEGSSDEYKQDSTTTDSTCTDEDIIPELDEKKSKKRKKTTPENKAAKVSKVNPVPERPNASNVVTKVMDACSFFYRFSCEWNVTGAAYGMSTNSNNNKIMCKRKFTKIDEARDHLANHHVARVLSNGLALQCCWQSCDVEFSDEDELKEHVVVHAEVKSAVTPYATTPTPVEHTVPVSKVKKNSGVSWYTTPLHALLLCDALPSHPQSTRCSMTCYSCRFREMKNKLQNPTKSSIMKEFRDLVGKFNGYKDEPFKFLSCFLALAVEHEEASHKSHAIKDLFWADDVADADLRCKKHTDGNMINVFPTLYKNCKVCTLNSKRWPDARKKNLILALDQSAQTHLDLVIFIKGREYQLRTVLCVDAKTGKYYLHSYKSDERWTTYRGDNVMGIKAERAIKDKGAIVVFYASTEERDALLSDVAVSDDELPPAEPVVVPAVETKSNVEIKTNVEIKSNVEQPRLSERFPLFPPDEKYQICDRKGADFNAQFASRKLANHNGVSSCINSTLQALLTTGLSNIQKRMCGPQAGCYLCHVSSATLRVLQTREGKTVDPFELALKKGGLGVPDAGEGDPISYLVGLIEAVAVDEESWHSSSDTKYKFTIRFQKSCPCTESCEAYHWVVRPSNVNQSLNDLMMEHSVHCAQCGVLAKTQPVMMPENLIFTVESTLQDSRLRYPEDFPTRNGRYFLSAVIVATGSPRHYSAYCRVFGVWMHYDDEDSRKVSCGDVLYQGAEVCALVYVTKELTVGDIRLAIAKAKELNETKVPIIVKEERN